MREKRKKLDKNNEKLKLRKIVKKQKLQEQGITLIALVVTIIILLILAGVTLNIALSDNGLFKKAKEATEKYEQAQSEEEDLISQFATQMYNEYVGATVEGYSPTSNSDGCTVESETTGVDDQKFTTDPDMEWRVWDYDGNILRIIGDPTSQKLTLNGAVGYNNGVWALDHLCKELYSNKKNGVAVTNLKRTDIQKVSTYDYTKYKHNPENADDLTNSDDNSIYFGETKTYEINNKYPDMWGENDKDWTYEYDNKNKKATGRDKECKIWEAIGTEEGQMENQMIQGSKETIFKQSYYKHIYGQNEFINDKYYDLIYKKNKGDNAGSYWLAGRCAHLYEEKCSFGLQRVNANGVSLSVVSSSLFTSDGNETEQESALRPIVSINLASSKCKMTSDVDETGKMTVNLKFGDG